MYQSSIAQLSTIYTICSSNTSPTQFRKPKHVVRQQPGQHIRSPYSIGVRYLKVIGNFFEMYNEFKPTLLRPFNVFLKTRISTRFLFTTHTGRLQDQTGGMMYTVLMHTVTQPVPSSRGSQSGSEIKQQMNIFKIFKFNIYK